MLSGGLHPLGLALYTLISKGKRIGQNEARKTGARSGQDGNCVARTEQCGMTALMTGRL